MPRRGRGLRARGHRGSCRATPRRAFGRLARAGYSSVAATGTARCTAGRSATQPANPRTGSFGGATSRLPGTPACGWRQRGVSRDWNEGVRVRDNDANPGFGSASGVRASPADRARLPAAPAKRRRRKHPARRTSASARAVVGRLGGGGRPRHGLPPGAGESIARRRRFGHPRRRKAMATAGCGPSAEGRPKARLAVVRLGRGQTTGLGVRCGSVLDGLSDAPPYPRGPHLTIRDRPLACLCFGSIRRSSAQELGRHVHVRGDS
jgi:hypothetical protein